MRTSSPCFQNILLATDFSECAAVGLATAVGLARKLGAKLTVGHVVRDVPGTFAALDYGTGWQVTPDELERLQKELRGEAEQRLQALVAEHRAADVEIASQTLIGSPYLAIIEAVKQNAFDLVVVGTRGMSAIKRVFVGSTATRLARMCPAPVWIARPRSPAEGQRILVPLDFSPIGERLLSVATSLALALGAQLHYLHVYDIDDLHGLTLLTGETPDEMNFYRQVARRAALEKLDQSLKTLGIDQSSGELHVSHGVPAHVIASTAKRLDASLIVMGSVGRSGISALLIGNTAEKVMHASKCSVLVVKPQGFVAERPTMEGGGGEQILPVAAASATRRRW